MRKCEIPEAIKREKLIAILRGVADARRKAENDFEDMRKTGNNEE